GGGVAANRRLRRELATACEAAGATLHLTPMHLCTDNGAMIAALAHHRLARGEIADTDLEARA
ncbi:MAG: tRNA (adenosine(37)-N6)-threonylcarbamoyltransferase complex transferase subunit TsaD, partial [Phycisphaerae bacterium]